MDVLVELAAPASEEAVPVLDAHGGVAEVVILHRGDADHLVNVRERSVEEPPLLSFAPGVWSILKALESGR